MFMANLAHVPYDTYNTIRGVEFTGEWIADAIEHMRRNGLATIDASAQAQDAFTRQVSDIAKDSLLMKGNSWYLGSNVPGKPRVVMSWFGGFQSYKALVHEVVRNGYAGFDFQPIEVLPPVKPARSNDLRDA
jgi:cyclohexanone monooxygenase